MSWIGDYTKDQVVRHFIQARAPSGVPPTNVAGTITTKVWRDGTLVTIGSGITVNTEKDSETSVVEVVVDTAADADWQRARHFAILVEGVDVDSNIVEGLFSFGIELNHEPGRVEVGSTAQDSSSSSLTLANDAVPTGRTLAGDVLRDLTDAQETQITTASDSTDVAAVSPGWEITPANNVRYNRYSGFVGLTADEISDAVDAGTVGTEVTAIKAKTDNLPADPADASDITAQFATLSTAVSTAQTAIDAVKAKTDNLPSDPADASVLAGLIATAQTAIDAVKAKTDNLPSDPADASVIAADLATITSSLTTIATYIDTEVAAIKAKTDNLPSDPADASDVAASFSTVISTLSTIAAYIDTEVAAIKAKTDNLPADPADASDISGAFSTVSTTLATIAAYIDTEVAAIKAKTDNLPSDPADASDIAALFAASPAAVALAIVRALGGQDGYSFDADTDLSEMVVVTPSGSFTATLTRAVANPVTKID